MTNVAPTIRRLVLGAVLLALGALGWWFQATPERRAPARPTAQAPRVVKAPKPRAKTGLRIERPNATFIVEADPANGPRLVVRVLGSDGAPIEGAEVTSAPLGLFDHTDDRGLLLIGWPPGTYTIHVSAAGHGRVRRTVEAPGIVDVALHPEATISGEVVDQRGLFPGTDGSIHAILSAEDRGSANVSDDGRFTIDRLAPGAYELTADGVGWFGRLEAPVVVEAGQHVTGVQLVVRSVTLVSARLVQADGAPCADGEVELSRAGSDLRWSIWIHDGRGKAEVPPGTYAAAAVCQERTVVGPPQKIDGTEATIALTLR
ncbi:MAG: carboxypeptidase regulatory-like domain-containing protein [Deltaproteobacteria bacterium]